MPDSLPLNDKWIAITRPLHQAKKLQMMLESAGAHPILFPLLEIKPPDNLALIKKQLNNLGDYDLVIFVSANAVDQAFRWLNTKVFLALKVATTGKKTASVLRNYGQKIDFCPEKIFNSEALLAMPDFRAFCTGKKVAIIRGESGRDLLRDKLCEMGAKVDYLNVYQRACPQKNLGSLEKHWKLGKLDTVLLTSGTSVDYFFNLAEGKDWVNELTVLLGSPRMQKKIPDHFRGKLLVADDPSDETLYKKLITSHG